MLERVLIGWDIGGAHVKACRMERGEVVAVAQWSLPAVARHRTPAARAGPGRRALARRWSTQPTQ